MAIIIYIILADIGRLVTSANMTIYYMKSSFDDHILSASMMYIPILAYRNIKFIFPQRSLSNRDGTCGEEGLSK